MGRKNDFFRFFFVSCTSTHRGATFLFLSKFHIFSRSEKSWGGQVKSVTSNDERRTNDERTTNERRTTWTIIRPRQDSFIILGLIKLFCDWFISKTWNKKEKSDWKQFSTIWVNYNILLIVFRNDIITKLGHNIISWQISV